MAEANLQSTKNPYLHIAKTFLAGGVAGCCAKTAIAPLDRVKILLQAHKVHYNNLGVMSTLTQVVKIEGFLGLYKGNGAQMVRIFPYSAVQFVAYEQYRKVLRHTLGFQSTASKLAEGSLAGMTAVITTYPLDVVRARLAFQSLGEIQYRGIVHTLNRILTKEGGLKGMYRGITPTLLGMIPYAGISFYVFEVLKKFCLKSFPNVTGTPYADGLTLTMPAKLFCGALAGAMAQTVSYPLDVARRNMQLSTLLPNAEKYSSCYQTLRTIYMEHGIYKGLYRGLTVNYMRVPPMVAVSFTVYETMRQLLHMDVSVDR
ncbi:solute carrier family 25 member 16-like [Lineus longissimus]|uniref:solute carrier family 25 member 16-like n=1 Tax=Lineus longissimus TaxID=88925 RepID=UPI002B4CB384